MSVDRLVEKIMEGVIEAMESKKKWGKAAVKNDERRFMSFESKILASKKSGHKDTMLLMELSKHAGALSKDLLEEYPTDLLALEGGITDEGYLTHKYGWVKSYKGEVIIVLDNGTKWRCKGVPSTGTGETLFKEGYIEFSPYVDREGGDVYGTSS